MSNRSVKTEFGRRVIDEIKRRTQEDNIDKNGKKFKGYAKSYVESDIFEIYGKSSSDVNLTLTSEMLSSMAVTDTTENGVVISFISEKQALKAQGHIEGIPRMFGKVKGKVKRDFFGLPEKDQQQILKDTVRDFQESRFDFDTSIEEPQVG